MDYKEELVDWVDCPSRIIQYGSRSRGEAHKNSDCNIAVITSEYEYLMNKSSLETGTELDLDIRIFDVSRFEKGDVQSIGYNKPLFCHTVKETGSVIHSDIESIQLPKVRFLDVLRDISFQRGVVSTCNRLQNEVLLANAFLYCLRDYHLITTSKYLSSYNEIFERYRDHDRFGELVKLHYENRYYYSVFKSEKLRETEVLMDQMESRAENFEDYCDEVLMSSYEWQLD